MAIDKTKLTMLSALEDLAQRTKTITDGHESRIAALETAGGQPNVIEGFKVNGTALEIAEKFVNLLVATGSANGTISIAGVDYAVKGLAELAYKSEISEDELADALKTLINGKAAQTDLNTLSGKVSTLIGSTSGDDAKSVRIISAEEVAKVVASAPEDFDTLKEIADWISSHSDDAAAMNSAITALQNKVVLGTYDDNGTQKEYATVKAYVEAVIAGLNMSQYATTSAMNTALNGKVDKVDGKGLSANDFTDDYKTKLDGLNIATSAEVKEVLDGVFGPTSNT